MSHATPHAVRHDSHHAEGAIHIHAVPPWLLLTVFGCLLVLTVVTVAITKVPLGPFAIWAALGIAVLKATLVVLYFMHLRWDAPFNAIIFISALLFVAIFIGMTITDSAEYEQYFTAPQSSSAQLPQ